MPVTVGEQDAGSTVEMYAGDILEVALRGNPTTGYTWEVSSVDTAILTKVGKTAFTAERTARGSGGTITMRFRAVTAGKTVLKLIYHRAFEKSKPPINTFEVHVIVKER
jgi:inhibitor of cysteine peptidase